MKNTLLQNLYTLFTLTKRSLLIFLKDKLAVFFSMLSPLIVLVLYIFFLNQVQLKGLVDSIPSGVEFSEKALNMFLDGWLMSGVMTVTCITVAFGASNVMVKDKYRGRINDLLSSPVSKRIIVLSYFLYTYILTVMMCLGVFSTVLVIMLAKGSFTLTFLDVLAALGVTLLSAAYSTFFCILIASFFKSEAALSGFCGIVSATAGFLVGAYMPISLFPKPVQYIVAFIPNTYSGGLFRNVFLKSSLASLESSMPQEFIASVKDTYCLSIDFFGISLNPTAMLLILLASTLLAALANLLLATLHPKSSPLLKRK